MTRRKFNSDLAHACQQTVDQISQVAKGDDDGQVVLTFSHGAISSPLVMRLITLNIDDYPQNSGFLAYTDDDSTPRSISALLDELPSATQSKTVLETLTYLSRKLSIALAADGNGSDVEMTDENDENDDDDDEETEGEDEYDYDDDIMDFGLGNANPAYIQQSDVTQGTCEITRRFIDDLRKAKSAGLKIAFLGDLSADQQSGCTFALSLPVSHLGLPDDTLEAWEVERDSYIVLLCKYHSAYPSVENFIKLSPGHVSSMEFSFGKCASYKPTLASAITAFNPKFNHVDVDDESKITEGTPFVQIPITNSIDTFMNKELSLLLKYRLEYAVSWDRAKELLDEQAKAGHMRADTSISAHGTEYTPDDKQQVSSAARPSLNKDYARGERDQLSMPLIAMQFALRYFVKSTQYCLVCHRKTGAGLTAIKPYVCDEPLCLFQYMALGLGPSIEHDIISRPSVVDLLVSFCAYGLHANRIREFPKGLGIYVPLFGYGSMPIAPVGYIQSATNTGGANDFNAQDVPAFVINPPLKVQATISGKKFFLDTSQQVNFKPGDLIVLEKAVCVTGRVEKPDLHHCRVTSVGVIRNADDNIVGRMVEFDCLFSTLRHLYQSNPYGINDSNGQTTPAAEDADSAAAEDEESEAALYFYEYDLDDLPVTHQRDALLSLIQTIPPIRLLREYLLSHKNISLKKYDKMTKSALALLRWIVASNRSFIVQLDQSDESATNDMAYASNREHEKISGLDSNWLQFRFAQGSPEKEQRFNQALEQQSTARYPTMFAWHGSPLGNWHSIIRAGLDFKDTLHGRAYGHGVYFSNALNVSIGYAGSSHMAGLWVGSELEMSGALSLCEIINRPAEFKSSQPYYVVDKVNWIQCRYLVIQRKSSFRYAEPEADGAPSATKTETEYITQDPQRTVAGISAKVRIPIAALPKWRQKARPEGSSPSNPLVVDDDDHDNTPDTTDDFDLLLSMKGNTDGTQHTEDDDEDIMILEYDPSKLSFRPGTLDVASLPILPPPTWATDNGLKLLGKELSKLQKLQAKTPLHELGWYIDFESMSNMFQWIVELHSFELSLPLAQDMQKHKVSSIVLEVRFGRQFPLSPPFVRVIRPKFLPFSQRGGGHVTAGGALCMELLTNSGWSPVSSIESVLLQVRMAMCSLDPFPARLLGSSGDYGIWEAIDAYKRSASAHGWQVPPDLDVTANGV
ncbi:hypothetical protein K4K60_003701 [Colletotrichum sp. SAR11_57]|nr:hypothetical protein K4K60_003701 [Colletotrichum sp. SAR11_57]